MIRYYGRPPYRAAVIHGGPGAPGSAAGLAAMAGEICGTSEPMQSQSAIRELEAELKNQLVEAGSLPAVLIGHSWGALLAALFAGAHPEMVEKLILVGCPPLTADYVPQIKERRRQNLSVRDQEELERLTARLEQGGPRGAEADGMLARLDDLARLSDCYDPLQSPAEELLPVDGEKYNAVWGEAAALRSSGALLNRFRNLTRPVTFIQGRQDPHPAAGISEPLAGSGLDYKLHVLDRCGHSPWLERQAREHFFAVLKRELDG